MNSHWSAYRRVNHRYLSVGWRGASLGALLLLFPGVLSAQTDVRVGFFAGAYAHSSATNSSSVTISTTFPDTDQCVFPAIAVRVAIRNVSDAQAPIVNSITWAVSGTPSQTLSNATQGWSSQNEHQRKRTEIWVMAGPTPGAGTATVSLSGNADVVADIVAACGVNQTDPALPASTSQATSSQTTTAGCAPFSTLGGLALDVVAIESGITATASNPSGRSIDMSNVVVNGTLATYSSHYTDTIGIFVTTPQWSLSSATYWVDSGVVLQPYAPTRVGLSSLAAEPARSGVQLRWRTGFEAENLGYRVYRERNGVRVPVNGALIAGSALSFRTARLEAGYTYAWGDPQGQPGDRYWLESVDLSGRHEWHGPAEVQRRKHRSLQAANSPLLTSLGRPATASAPAQRPARPTVDRRSYAVPAPNFEEQGEIAAGAAAKIAVREDGWYRVTFQELSDAGFPVNASDASTLQLYTDGLEQAIEVRAADGSELTSASDTPGAIEFYGSAADTPYTDSRVYYLVKGSRPGLRVGTVRQSVSPLDQEVSFPYTVEHRERSFYVSGVINGAKENFWGRFIGSEGIAQTLVADHIATAPKAAVEVSVQGLGVAHDLVVSLNGTEIGTMSLAPWQAGSQSFQVPDGLLVDGENALTLASSTDDGYSLFDTVRLTYQRMSTADNDSLVMVVSGSTRNLLIDGFSEPSVRVVDTTIPGRPMELLGSVTMGENGYGIGVRALVAPWHGDQRALLAFTGQQVKHPAAVTANVPSSWRTDSSGADVVMITTRGLHATLAPLVALRRSQGLSVAVVDVEDIYDEFSYGMKSAQAVRDFLQGASLHWQTTPRFVVLVGNGTYDPRDYLGLGGDLLPTMHVDTSEMEALSDDWYVDFDEDGVPDIPIGRLPVADAQQADGVVSKLVAYEGSSRSFSSALFIADKAIGSNFQLINSQLTPLVPSSVAVERANVGDSDVATVRTQLLQALENGVDVVHYAGHGSVDHLRGNLLTTADAASLGNPGHPAVFTMMNCLVGMFDDPSTVALGKALVDAPEGGAIAVWASSGTTTAPDQEAMMKAFFTALEGNATGGMPTLGEAVTSAKAAASDGDVRRTWIFLGDPATTLR